MDESKADKECCTCCRDTDYIQQWHFILVSFVGTTHYQNVRIHAEDFKTCSLSAEQCCNNIVSILLVVEDPVPFVGKEMLIERSTVKEFEMLLLPEVVNITGDQWANIRSVDYLPWMNATRKLALDLRSSGFYSRSIWWSVDMLAMSHDYAAHW